MKQRLLSMLVLCVLLIGSAYAQNRQVSGTVTSATDGTPISGVSVRVVGTSTATQTSGDGSYTISVPDNNGSLSFTYIGYQSFQTAIGTRAVINVQLASDDETLDEVVVTGYMVQSKKDFTGASAKVSGETVANRPLQSFTQGLTGQASGVNIIQPSGVLNNPPVVRVRGLSSLSLSSFPLVVVDGIPISTGDVSENSAANNPLGDINPEDIESVDILKDAASTAIYGSRGAAGVLLITTKRGKAGAAKVSYDGWFGSSKAVRLAELMNAEQYIAHKNNAIKNAREINPKLSTASYPVDGGFFPTLDANGNPVDTRWYDFVYDTGISHNHNLSVSGGNEATKYFFSGNLSDQDGILVKNSFKRKGVRANIDHKVTDWFKLGANLNFTNSANNSPNSGSVAGAAFNTSGLGRIAMVQAPNVPGYLPNGDYNVTGSSIGKGANVLAPNYPNPLPIRDLDKNSSETNRFFANINSTFNLLDGLTLNNNFTWDLRNTNNQQFWNPINGDGYSFNGYAYNNSAKSNNWVVLNSLVYNKSFGDHNLVVLAGHEAQSTRVENWGGVRYDLTDWYFNQYQGNFLTNDAGGNGIGENRIQSFLTSLNYNFANKYYFTANFRRDGLSALAAGKKWGNFGGVSAGWTISQEEFFKSSSLANVVSNLRLNASWGRVGNSAISNSYGSFDIYDPTIYGNAGGMIFTQAGNRELGWETSDQTNFGIDVGFLDNRVSLEASYYNKDHNGLILAVPQTPSKGIPGNSILMNIGSMYNRGFEFALNVRAVQKENFKWTTTLNFSTNKNEVTALDNEGRPLIATTAGLETTSITEVGKSAAQIYAVPTNGVNPANGRRIFINRDGEEVQYLHNAPNTEGFYSYSYLDGTRAAGVAGDAVAAGNTLPTYFGGFNNNFQFGNFDATLNFTFSGGNYIYNGTRAGLRDQRIWNNSVDMLDSWTPENKNSDIPRAIYGDNISNGSAFAIQSNIEKGDFIRLQTASLGYRLPSSIFGKSGISSLRVYAAVNNAFLITKYTGVDPEISSNGDGNLNSGVERNSMPNGRTFTFGINLGF
ncbi:SusC/RagA family TonB-linked outer membrane protein [Sphingobacterium endophyticum]|uniref:SusC/RagA family TonB-linked outer membrane protein n=1 Tax=Sphingobacterium endophyticum TaxID=2546448 RepID=UPI0012E1302D|nr:SusC/RagA family TonB-linked outer membrane protein [Sphingobacterium endophyticum]